MSRIIEALCVAAFFLVVCTVFGAATSLVPEIIARVWGREAALIYSLAGVIGLALTLGWVMTSRPKP